MWLFFGGRAGLGLHFAPCREKRWVDEALEATAPGLRARLGGDEAIVDSHEGVGNVSGYMCQRWWFWDGEGDGGKNVDYKK